MVMNAFKPSGAKMMPQRTGWPWSMGGAKMGGSREMPDQYPGSFGMPAPYGSMRGGSTKKGMKGMMEY